MTSPTPTDAAKFLTRHQAAEVAHVSTATLDKILRQADAPPVRRVGRRVLIPHGSFVAWLQASARTGHDG